MTCSLDSSPLRPCQGLYPSSNGLPTNALVSHDFKVVQDVSSIHSMLWLGFCLLALLMTKPMPARRHEVMGATRCASWECPMGMSQNREPPKSLVFVWLPSKKPQERGTYPQKETRSCQVGDQKNSVLRFPETCQGFVVGRSLLKFVVAMAIGFFKNNCPRPHPKTQCRGRAFGGKTCHRI